MPTTGEGRWRQVRLSLPPGVSWGSWGRRSVRTDLPGIFTLFGGTLTGDPEWTAGRSVLSVVGGPRPRRRVTYTTLVTTTTRDTGPHGSPDSYRDGNDPTGGRRHFPQSLRDFRLPDVRTVSPTRPLETRLQGRTVRDRGRSDRGVNRNL